MAQPKKEEQTQAQAPQRLRLTLVVEYEPEDDFRGAAAELIERARELGCPISAVLTGVPSTLVLL